MERILGGVILGLITWFSFQSILIAVLYVGELLFVLVKRPYSGKRSNWRPVANLIIIILIATIYYLMNSMKGSALQDYGPLAVLILLIACFIYSTILLVIDLKDTITKMCS